MILYFGVTDSGCRNCNKCLAEYGPSQLFGQFSQRQDKCLHSNLVSAVLKWSWRIKQYSGKEVYNSLIRELDRSIWFWSSENLERNARYLFSDKGSY